MPFAMAIGGGFDIKINHRLLLRPFQMDYLMTRFSEPLVNGFQNRSNQANFRYQAGLIFTFGE